MDAPWISKFSETPMIGDEAEWMRQQMRATLSNYTMETPSLASDQNRETSANTRDRHMNIRFGRDEVYQPDLFLGNMSKDPRRTTTAPDMSQYVSEARARADNYRKSFANDDCNVVIDGVKSGKALKRTMTSMTEGFKKRFKNFGSTVESYTRPTNIVRGTTMKVSNFADLRKPTRENVMTSRYHAPTKSALTSTRSERFNHKINRSAELVPSSVSTSAPSNGSQVVTGSHQAANSMGNDVHCRTVMSAMKAGVVEYGGLHHHKANRLETTGVVHQRNNKAFKGVSRAQTTGHKQLEAKMATLLAAKHKKRNILSAMDVTRGAPTYTQKGTSSREIASMGARSAMSNQRDVANSIRMTSALYKTGRELDTGMGSASVQRMLAPKVSRDNVFEVKHKPIDEMLTYESGYRLPPTVSGHAREQMSQPQHKSGKSALTTPMSTNVIAPKQGDLVVTQSHGSAAAVRPAGSMGTAVRAKVIREKTRVDTSTVHGM